jgi:uncharacterized protein YdhG (YjbR/CyaY superfamily)
VTPADYISQLPQARREEVEKLDSLIRETAPKLESGLYGAMLGYGPYRYRYASGREGSGFKIALASQKNYISLYASIAVQGVYIPEKYRDRLPKASIGKSCVRFKRLSDLDEQALRELIAEAAAAEFA